MLGICNAGLGLPRPELEFVGFIELVGFVEVHGEEATKFSMDIPLSLSPGINSLASSTSKAT
jgi:hypothetical protein